ncbi:outer membrane protein [Paracoccus fontiphilus]|uniref:Outer membrane protein n=1 Tax=Paracoccus fontiphilus TaxID=1815556 RepID=A0ABV7IGM2_9RHOB|nr:porin family protein [Paracoccus fontiphilus]
MKFVALTVAATLAASASFAGGYVAPVVETAPVVAPVVPVEAGTDWTGFYAGLQYGQGSAEVSDNGGESDFDGYGAHVGYLRDFGKVIAGAELDYNKADLDEADEDADLWRLRARAGYDMGRFQPYVTLGAAHVSLDTIAGDISETGITYGVGAEYLVTEKFSVGAEYSRSDFSDVIADGVDLDTDLVQVRASYRF